MKNCLYHYPSPKNTAVFVKMTSDSLQCYNVLLYSLYTVSFHVPLSYSDCRPHMCKDSPESRRVANLHNF